MDSVSARDTTKFDAPLGTYYPGFVLRTSHLIRSPFADVLLYNTHGDRLYEQQSNTEVKTQPEKTRTTREKTERDNKKVRPQAPEKNRQAHALHLIIVFRMLSTSREN